MNSAEKFSLMLEAMVGEEELTEMQIYQAVECHPPHCQCDECEYFRQLLFGEAGYAWEDEQ